MNEAVFSEDLKKRYLLTRYLDNPSNDIVTFIMLNPSTADAEKDDPTIRRCISFSTKFGFGKLHILNLFPLRSPYPKDLWKDENSVETIDAQNEQFMCESICQSKKIVAAWGKPSGPKWFIEKKLNIVISRVLSICNVYGTKVHVLDLTQDNKPKHPLYLSKSCNLLEWNYEVFTNT